MSEETTNPYTERIGALLLEHDQAVKDMGVKFIERAELIVCEMMNDIVALNPHIINLTVKEFGMSALACRCAQPPTCITAKLTAHAYFGCSDEELEAFSAQEQILFGKISELIVFIDICKSRSIPIDGVYLPDTSRQ